MSFEHGLARVAEDLGLTLSRRAAALGVMCAASLSGCAFFPSDGPSPHSVVASASFSSQQAPAYVLVKLTPELMPYVGQPTRRSLKAMGSPGPAPRVMLGIGDVVAVTVFEAASGGLFIPSQGGSRPGNYVQLPDQLVDNSGNITVPYAGAVRAAGRSIPDIQADVVEKLRSRAIEPQVVITLKDQKASQVSVLGEVNAPARFPINPSGDRVLDVIAKAGGPKYPAYESYVTIQRGGKEGTELLASLVARPADNVYVRPGDILILSRKAQTFVALGASGLNGQFPFDAEDVTLSEGLGKAGGLIDGRANPRYLFLYRLEGKETIARLGYPVEQFAGDLVPVIYTVDVQEPSGYFLASRFYLHDKDVLYAANAVTVDLAKVFGFVRGTVGTVKDTKSL
ncbi:polysaccharide biosynthesis/export family protein [soil metagenome]